MNDTNLSVKLPEELLRELEARLKRGEFKSEHEAVSAALEYYFDRHSSQAMAVYVDEELRAGLE